MGAPVSEFLVCDSASESLLCCYERPLKVCLRCWLKGLVTNELFWWYQPLLKIELSVLLNEFSYLPLLRVVTIILGGRFTLSFINGSTIPPEVNDVE